MIEELQEAKALLLKISKQTITDEADLKSLSEIANTLNPDLQKQSIFKIDTEINQEMIELAKLIKPILASNSIFTKDKPHLQEFATLILQQTATITDFQRELKLYLRNKLYFEIPKSITVEQEYPIYDADGNIVGTADLVVNVIKDGKIIKQFPIECDGSSHEDRDDSERDRLLDLHFKDAYLIIEHGKSDFGNYCETTGTTAIDELIQQIRQQEDVKRARQERLAAYKEKRYQEKAVEQVIKSNDNKFHPLCEDELEDKTKSEPSKKSIKPIPKSKRTNQKSQEPDDNDKALEEILEQNQKEEEREKKQERIINIIEELIEDPSKMQEAIQQLKTFAQNNPSNTEFLSNGFEYLFANDHYLALDFLQEIETEPSLNSALLIKIAKDYVFFLLEREIYHPFLLNDTFSFFISSARKKDTDSKRIISDIMSKIVTSQKVEFVEKLLKDNPQIRDKAHTICSNANEITETLIVASKEGNIEIVKLLLDKGANVNAKDKRDGTALMIACVKGYQTIVELLLDNKGADVNAKNNKGDNALMFTSMTGYQTIVELLLDKGADVNVTNQAGETALIAASKEGNIEIVKLLLNRYANVDAKDKDGLTALMFASMTGYQTIVELLLDKGADVNAKNNKGDNALMIARKNGNETIEKILISVTKPSTVVEHVSTTATTNQNKSA